MSSLRKRLVAAVTVALATGCMGTGTASAGTFQLGLTPPPSLVVGQPTIMHATGVVAERNLAYPYFFNLEVIPTSVMTQCPTDRWAAVQVALQTGGAVVVLSQTITPGAGGAFDIPVGLNPTAPGTLLACGYVDDGLTHTLDVAQVQLTISPAGGAAPAPAQPGQPAGPAQPGEPAEPAKGKAKPTPASIAREVRSAARSCRALLSGRGARSCVRRAVRKGNAACRRLPGKRAKATCLRGVKRAAKA